MKSKLSRTCTYTSTLAWSAALCRTLLMLSGCTVPMNSSEDDMEEEKNTNESNATEEEEDAIPYTGAIELGQDIAAETMLKNTTASAELADYTVLKDVEVDARLTIEPGVRIEFKQDVRLIVKPNGQLVAQGSSEKPIVLSGAEPTPGFWGGIVIYSESAENILEHTEIAYGGGGGWYPANLTLGDDVGTKGKVQLKNSVIRDSGYYGMYCANCNLEGFSTNTFKDNVQVPAVLSVNQAAHLDSASIFDGNNGQGGNNYVLVGNFDITTNKTLHKLDVPFRFADNPLLIRYFAMEVKANLTVEAGARVEFDQDYGLVITDGGSLTAQGTAQDPIVFTGINPVPGAWRGLGFATLSQQNILDHVEVSYAGANLQANNEPSNILAGMWGDAGYLKITNSTIKGSSGCGLIHRDGSTLVESNNTFESNADGNVCTNN